LIKRIEARFRENPTDLDDFLRQKKRGFSRYTVENEAHWGKIFPAAGGNGGDILKAKISQQAVKLFASSSIRHQSANLRRSFS
jgi:hypothetical protein